jgi:putative NADH-flavin reductase
MNILILGATGRVGSQIVNHVLYDGHDVTVLVRNPEKIQINNENVTIIQGNGLNKDGNQRVGQSVQQKNIIKFTLC